MTDWPPPNPDFPPPKADEPPLHRAARVGDAQAIRTLLRQGADIDSVFDLSLDPDAQEWPATPLMVAAGSGDGATVETVRCLLDLGADPRATTAAGSAATFACSGLGWNYRPGGDAARLGLLLNAGSPLPTNEEDLNRLLCETAGSGDADRLKVLLDQGLRPDGYWDAERAKEQHRWMMGEMARHRESEPDPFAGLPEEVRAQLAETHDELEQEMFKEQSSAPSSYEIPLFRAAQAPDGDCLMVLLAAGANAHVRDNAKRTAMYYASSAAAVRALMEAGVPLEDADRYGWSPLADAVSDGIESLPRIRALIAAGANVNATHDHGYTLFMSAVGSGRHIDVLKLLIASGADAHAVSDLGYNAFHAAIDVNFEANAEPSVRETLGYLRELGVDIERRHNGGQSPLARAIEEGTGIEVSVLCDLGANPNAVCPSHECGDEGCTRVDVPLIFSAAVSIGVDKDVKTDALLRAGADPLMTDAEGFTPLQRTVAKLCSDADDYEIAYRAFFEELGKLRLDGEDVPQTREGFVSAAGPAVERFVKQFASRIPVPTACEYDAQWREERLACIISLCAHEGWARHQRRTHRPPST